ncbi:MAG: sulfide/dihydroorotate dehydrogenase-like FAD/NAD-binding protein [Ignavibacteriae bacterium]|nr:sulfide/dihydroorotate dehydrogenase-like FAD/NAD-binding protein [Ignavibacteriota bacterium]
MFPIVSKEFLCSTIAKFVIKAPYVARKHRPGNFVIVRLLETGERIPLTIVESDSSAGSITLIVQAVGKTTKAMLSKNSGDVLVDVVGPLGNPTPIEYYGGVACIGGGVGTAELYPIACALKEVQNTVYSVIGARTKERLILEKEMSEISNGMFITTDDGSYKRKGLVTEPLKELLDAPLGISAVYAIGPLPMMKAVSALTKKYGVKTIVSLNAIMVDGTGMCGGCRVTVGGRMKFACVDGPEFDGNNVDFDELMMRNQTYVDLEQISDLRYCASKDSEYHIRKRDELNLHESLMNEVH